MRRKRYMKTRWPILITVFAALLVTSFAAYYFFHYIPDRDLRRDQESANATRAVQETQARNLANAYLSCAREAFTTTFQERALKDSIKTQECWKDKVCITKEVNVVHKMADDTCIQKFPDAKIDMFPDLNATYEAIFSSTITSLGPK